MSRQELSPMVLPPGNVPTFCRPRSRRGVLGFTSGSSNHGPGSGVIARLIMGSFRFIVMGLLFKVVVPFGTMALLFMFWPQILGMVMPGDAGGGGNMEASSGMNGMTLVRWSWALLKQSVVGIAESWFHGN